MADPNGRKPPLISRRSRRPRGIVKTLNFYEVPVGVSHKALSDVEALIVGRGPLHISASRHQTLRPCFHIFDDQRQDNPCPLNRLQAGTDSDEGRRRYAEDPTAALIQNKGQLEHPLVKVGRPLKVVDVYESDLLLKLSFDHRMGSHVFMTAPPGFGVVTHSSGYVVRRSSVMNQHEAASYASHRYAVYILLISSTCLAAACGSTPPKTPAKVLDRFCPPGTHPQNRVLHGETYRWCSATSGEPDGPYLVEYKDGQPKLKLHTRLGLVHGQYRAFHPHGRRAVEQTYRHGKPDGVGRYWPPHGPELSCLPQDCAEQELTLGRPYCRPEQISASLATRQAQLNGCLKGYEDLDESSAVTAQWWLDLLGRPYGVQVRSTAAYRAAGQCIEGLIRETTFAAPFGDVCSIRMSFELRP